MNKSRVLKINLYGDETEVRYLKIYVRDIYIYIVLGFFLSKCVVTLDVSNSA